MTPIDHTRSLPDRDSLYQLFTILLNRWGNADFQEILISEDPDNMVSDALFYLEELPEVELDMKEAKAATIDHLCVGIGALLRKALITQMKVESKRIEEGMEKVN